MSTAKAPAGSTRNLDTQELISRYGYTGLEIPPWERLRKILIGPSGSGKTTVAQSDPTTIVFDWEGGCGFSESRAIVVPRKTEQLTYDVYLKLRNALLKDAMAGRDVPVRSITHDTFDSYIYALDRYLTDRENKRRASRGREPLTSIVDLGEGGYRLVASEILADLMLIEQAGFGWTLVTHLDEKKVRIRLSGSTEEITRHAPAVWPSIWRMIAKRADIIWRFRRSFKRVVGTRVVNGKKVADPKTARMVPVVTMSAWPEDPDEEVAKSRLPLPELREIPEQDAAAWIREKYEALAAGEKS